MPISTPLPKPPTPAPATRPRPTRVGRKIPTSALIGLTAGLLTGYGIGRFSIPLAPTYQEGYDAAREKLEKLHFFPSVPNETSILMGRIVSVGRDSLEFEVDLTVANPLEQLPGPAKRTVRITPTTKFYRIAQKSGEELQKEQQDALTAAGGDLTKYHPVNPSKEIPIPLSEVTAGSFAQISADHNILKESVFDATEVRIR